MLIGLDYRLNTNFYLARSVPSYWKGAGRWLVSTSVGACWWSSRSCEFRPGFSVLCILPKPWHKADGEWAQVCLHSSRVRYALGDLNAASGSLELAICTLWEHGNVRYTDHFSSISWQPKMKLQFWSHLPASPAEAFVCITITLP